MSERKPHVAHDEEGRRFVVAEDGATAELTYRLGAGQIVFLHTGVPPELEGHGVGSALAKAGLEYAKEQGLQVIPICPFVRSYIERKPEYQSLVHRPASA